MPRNIPWDSSDPRDVAALYTNGDHRRFYRVSGRVAGAALADTVALGPAEAMGTATGHHAGETAPPVTGKTLKTRKQTLFGVGYYRPPPGETGRWRRWFHQYSTRAFYDSRGHTTRAKLTLQLMKGEKYLAVQKGNHGHKSHQ